MSPKYNLLNFTESYRHAEGQHTVLLPAAMALVIGVSFWLVAQSRPSVKSARDDTSVSSGMEQGSMGRLTISAPPKIDFEFGPVLGEVPVVDPGIDISQGKTEKKVPVAKVVSNDISSDSNPIISLPRAQGRFTPWMTPTELNEHILEINEGHTVSFWDRGHWIIAVEGRHDGITEEFRIVYEKTPKNQDFEWRYRIAQARQTFAKNMLDMERAGFVLVQSQSFKTSDGTRRFQAVWQKVD